VQISSILDIVDGELLNSPSISFIYSIKTNAKKVKEGDLFIAKNSNDIELAIKHGAFAIIIEENFPIIDNEIAWIKVKEIEISIIKLIRYKLSVLNLEAYFCDIVAYQLLKLYSSSFSKRIKLIPNKLENLFKNIDELEEKNIIVSSNPEILNKIYPQNKNFNEITTTLEIENLIEHSLFETSFSFKGVYFSKLKISSLYLAQFLRVYNFLDGNLDFNKLKQFNNLKPLFIDRNLNLIEFGKSDRFIICQDIKNLYEYEILYLKIKYKYAKTLFITLSYIKYLPQEEQIIINNLDELKPMLKKLKFNAVYLIGFNYNQVQEYFLRNEHQLTLF
jgi:ferrochelatase